MKQIGILGGMGPEATLHFYQKILQFTPAQQDQDHIPTLIYSNPKIPDRTQSILNQDFSSILNSLKESAVLLERGGSDLIAIPCNTAHYWHTQIQESVSVPVLHMIDLLAQHLKTSKSVSQVGLLATLGTIHTDLYQTCFKTWDIEVKTPSKPDQEIVMDTITSIKSGDRSSKLHQRLSAVIETFSNNNIDTCILGCTELPLIVSPHEKLIDPMDFLAQKAVALARS